MEQAEENYIVTAAIDFGTTFSGYCFGFNNSKDIYVNKNWGSEFSQSSYKTPTCVLTGPNNEFVSFGYEAENDFSEEKGSEAGYNLFRHFKMKLHDDKIYLNQYIESTTGNKALAKDIFVMAVKYLKEHMLESINNAHVSSLDNSLIKWVITVPAIWKEESKYFMRDVAYSAGIISEFDSSQLVVGLEPEVASVYCRSLSVDQCSIGNNDSFKIGEQYLLVDAGGGTVDITVHEIMDMERVKEVHPPSGGPWGGKYVDENFENLLREVFDSNFISSYKVNDSRDWMTLLLTFEKAKRLKKNIMNIPLTFTFGDEIQKYTGQKLDIYVKNKHFNGVTFKNGSLVISYEILQKFFKTVIDKIIDHLNGLLNNPKLNLKYVIFVGGFGECEILQKSVKDAFAGKIKVIIPQEAQLAVMKGAVLFGKQPELVVSRLARLTYGIGVKRPFEEGYHKSEYKFMNKGKWYCKNIFSKIILKHEEVKGSCTKLKDMGTTENSYKAGFSSVTIHYSDKDNPGAYITDHDVHQLAELVVYHDKSKSIDKTGTDVIFHVGGTEMIVEAKSTTGGEKVKTTLDFSSSLVE